MKSKASEYVIPERYLRSIDFDVDNFGIEDMLKLDEIVKELFPSIREGDIVALLPRHLRDNECPNKHLLIWRNTSGVEKLDFKTDPYGCIPNFFKVSDTRFSVVYWKNVIHDYMLFWPSNDLIARATSNVYRIPHSGPNCVSEFLIGKKPYLLVFNTDETGVDQSLSPSSNKNHGVYLLD